MSPELQALVADIADQTGLSMNEVYRQAIMSLLDDADSATMRLYRLQKREVAANHG